VKNKGIVIFYCEWCTTLLRVCANKCVLLMNRCYYWIRTRQL